MWKDPALKAGSFHILGAYQLIEILLSLENPLHRGCQSRPQVEARFSPV
jgi:hypothetical protein